MNEDRSAAELLRELREQSAALMRDEMALARAEMREKLDVFTRGTRNMALAAALFLGALGLAVVALNRGLTILLTEAAGAEIALWLAPVLLAATLGALGWVLWSSATSSLRSEGVVPRQTVRSVREDARFLRSEVSRHA